MTNPETELAVAAALAAAKLRAVRTGLLALHQAVLDAERRRYERTHGKVETAHHALRLVIDDPFFAWLRPIAALIVQADERLAHGAPLAPADVQAFGSHVRALLQVQLGGTAFHDEYLRTLQEAPDVVVAHGRILALLV